MSNDNIICDFCGFAGNVAEFDPSMSAYSDIRCPKCRSANNQHNQDYMERITKKMRESSKSVGEEE